MQEIGYQSIIDVKFYRHIRISVKFVLILTNNNTRESICLAN